MTHIPKPGFRLTAAAALDDVRPFSELAAVEKTLDELDENAEAAKWRKPIKLTSTTIDRDEIERRLGRRK